MAASKLGIVCCISAFFSLFVFIAGAFIMIIVFRTKPRLRTCRHLLMCNSSAALMFYSAIQNINYSFLIFLQSDTSDISCRCRGYLTYMSIVGVSYSYFIQSISRLFFTSLSAKHAALITFRTHFILIGLNWFAAIVIPLSVVVTDDIRFTPGSLCWIRSESSIHSGVTVIADYIVPLGLVMIIYAHIYYQVKKRRRNVRSNMITTNNERLELELLRNIAVLVAIFLLSGTPTVIYILTAIELFFFSAIVIISFCAVVVQICTIALDRDFRQVVQEMLRTKTRVQPFTITEQSRRNAMRPLHNPRTTALGTSKP